MHPPKAGGPWGGPWPAWEAREVHLDPTLLTWGGLVAVLVFSWAYRAADGRRHDFTFLNQGTFFLKYVSAFRLSLTCRMSRCVAPRPTRSPLEWVCNDALVSGLD